eukprot:10021871-Alexandrium_andersonii.AAC.1
MPPKKRTGPPAPVAANAGGGRGRGRGGNAAAPNAAVAARSPQSDVVRADNTAYLKEVQDDIDTVLEQFPDLKTKAPITSSAPAFTVAAMLERYSGVGNFICTFNLSLLSIQPPNPELPLSTKKKTLLLQHYYQHPALCKKLDLGVDKDIAKPELDRALEEGALPVCFPLEHLHAWWAGFAQA